MTVENHSFKDVPAIEVKYVLFTKPESAKSVPGKAQLERTEGTATIAGIKNNDRVTFETKAVAILVQQLKPGYVWSGSGSSSDMHDRLRGIWMKFYIDGQQVFEFVNPSELSTRGETFEAPAH